VIGSFKLRPVYPKTISVWFYMKLVEHQNRSWLSAEGRIPLQVPEIEPKFSSRPVVNLVTIPSELYRLLRLQNVGAETLHLYNWLQLRYIGNFTDSYSVDRCCLLNTEQKWIPCNEKSRFRDNWHFVFGPPVRLPLFLWRYKLIAFI
jgi:hypothetical protein